MKNNGYIKRDRVIDVLKTIRQEWVEASDGESLEEIYGSVGLLLDDIAHGLDIAIDEQVRVERH